MLKTIDVGLMANHLSVHNALIKKLELYASGTKNQQLIMLLEQHAGLMKNHVNVMNNLLNPDNLNQVSLPPIPHVTSHNHNTYSSLGLEDKDIATDAQITAMAMANNNFTSALNMKNPQVKKIHVEMALQQSQIAEQIGMLAQQNGWMSHPNASTTEQVEAQNPLQANNNHNHMPYYQNKNVNTNQPNQLHH